MRAVRAARCGICSQLSTRSMSDEGRLLLQALRAISLLCFCVGFGSPLLRPQGCSAAAGVRGSAVQGRRRRRGGFKAAGLLASRSAAAESRKRAVVSAAVSRARRSSFVWGGGLGASAQSACTVSSEAFSCQWKGERALKWHQAPFDSQTPFSKQFPCLKRVRIRARAKFRPGAGQLLGATESQGCRARSERASLRSEGLAEPRTL